jgi:hypothetical protein
MPVPPSRVEKISSFAATPCDVSSLLANATMGIWTKPPPKLKPALWLSSRRYGVLQASALALSGKSCPAAVPLVVAPERNTSLPITWIPVPRSPNPIDPVPVASGGTGIRMPHPPKYVE